MGEDKQKEKCFKRRILLMHAKRGKVEMSYDEKHAIRAFGSGGMNACCMKCSAYKVTCIVAVLLRLEVLRWKKIVYYLVNHQSTTGC